MSEHNFDRGNRCFRRIDIRQTGKSTFEPNGKYHNSKIVFVFPVYHIPEIPFGVKNGLYFFSRAKRSKIRKSFGFGRRTHDNVKRRLRERIVV